MEPYTGYVCLAVTRLYLRNRDRILTDDVFLFLQQI